MGNQAAGEVRPPIHLLAAESDMVASLALQAEHRHPLVAAMLLEEIERAELHEPETLPETAVTIGSQVDFVDEKSSQLRSVELVLPASANIAEGRISILTPMGAALLGLSKGQSITLEGRDGAPRSLTVLELLSQPHGMAAGCDGAAEKRA